MTDRELLEALYKDMQGMRQEMQGMKQEIADVKTLAAKTQIILENDVAKKINVLFEGHELQNQKLDTLIEKVDDLETSVLANEIVTKNNLKEIETLKRKAQ